MIRNLLILVFAFISLTAHAQFRMVGGAEAPGWSVDSPTDYSATVAFGEDRTGNGYLANQIVVDSFRAFTGTGQLYDVIFVGTTGLYEAEVTLRERDGDWGSPEGLIMVYDPGSRSKIPACPVAPDGSTNQIIAAIISYNSVIDDNGFFSPANVGATIPSGMYGVVTDNFRLHAPGVNDPVGQFRFTLSKDGVFPASDNNFLHFHADYDQSQLPGLGSAGDLIRYTDGAATRFRWFTISNNMWFANYDPTGTTVNGSLEFKQDGNIDLFAHGVISIGGSESDGISLTLPLPEISGSVDSVLAKTPAGVVGMIAISDIVSLATPQYAQTYMTGGTNTDVDAGTPERLNATTTGTVTSIIATSDFTNEADGDIQYTGPDNAVIKITANVSILTDDPPNFSFFIAINGTVVPESRTSAAAYLVSHNGSASITFFDADADQNDTYAIFMDTNGTNAVITVVDARLTAEVIK